MPPRPSFDSLEAIERQHHLLKSYRKEFGNVLPTSELMNRLVLALHQEAGVNCRVLDAGSGSGFLANQLCRLGVNAFAVDHFDYECRAEAPFCIH